MLNDDKITTVKQMRKLISRNLKESKESNDVSNKSTKILGFFVNDILDFAQLKSDKFRQDIQSFDLRQAVQEVNEIQKYKIEQRGIQIKTDYANFEKLVEK